MAANDAVLIWARHGNAFDVVDVDCEVPHAKKFYLIYFFSRLF